MKFFFKAYLMIIYCWIGVFILELNSIFSVFIGEKIANYYENIDISHYCFCNL